MRALFVLLLLAAVCSATDQTQPPHIVFILADDMGYGDPAFSDPDARIATPHLDRLAREGMRFRDAHSPGALCVPSRYGLLTGQFPCRRRRIQPGREAVIRPGTVTLPEVLRAAGYATAMIGKWHLGFDDAAAHDYTHIKGGPLDRGFDRFFGIPASLDIPPYYYIRDRSAVAAPTAHVAASDTEGWSPIQGAFWRAGDVAPGFDHAQVLPRCGDEAVAAIRRHAANGDDTPLFLYLALPAPHTPWLPLPPFVGSSQAGLYGDFVTQVDATIGRVVTALEAAGMAQDTLLFVSSDNGPVWYPQDVERFGHRATGLLRGMKADAFEGGHRVPLVVRWPGQIAGGTHCDALTCLTDVMATCAAVAGVTVPEGAARDSRSFLPQLRGEPEADGSRVVLLKADASVVRKGSWKLIRHRGSGGFTRRADTGPEPGQLYNLESDLGETANFHDLLPTTVAELTWYARAANPTNLIVVLADDMGYGDSSVYDGWIETPGLDRMAREGMVFTDFHSSGVVCSPTRAGLMTGRYQQRAGIPGVVNADPAHPDHQRGLRDEESTIAEQLRTAGFRTGLFGKWHLGYELRHNPVRHGFDEFRGFVSGNIDYQSHLDRMGTADWWHGEDRVEREGYLTELITADAVDFIARHGDEPFCLLVAHGAVHSPIQAPDTKPVRGPERTATPNGDRPRDDTVRLMMRSLDDSVSAILDAVRQHGIAGRTLVLFCSDNGGARHMRNDPLRGHKGTVWEGGHRVPAIAWWPGTVKRGSRTDALCCTLDIMPTVLDLAGLAQPTDRPLDGETLTPVLLGRRQPDAVVPRQLFWNGKAMREGRWKLVVHQGRELLFDLSQDIGETTDLAADHPERVQRMREALAAWSDDVAKNAPTLSGAKRNR